MSEHGCLKSESFISLGVERDLEVAGDIRLTNNIFVRGSRTSKFKGGVDFNGSANFNKVPYFNKGINIIGGIGHNTGFIMTDVGQVGPTPPNNASEVDLTFTASIGANDIISGLFLSVDNGGTTDTFKGFDSGGTTGGGVNIKLTDETGVNYFATTAGAGEGRCGLLNGSDSVLESGNTYSIIENHRIIGNGSMRHNVYVNASGFITTKDNPKDNQAVNASALIIQNDGNDGDRQLTLTLTASRGHIDPNFIFHQNCSVQAILRYEPFFPHYSDAFINKR